MKSLKFAIVTILLVLAATSLAFSEAEKVRVIASPATNPANIRTNPSVQSTIILTAPLGAVLDVVKKEGVWFLVQLPPNKDGFSVRGYIHQSTVEVIEEAASRAEEIIQKADPEEAPLTNRQAGIEPADQSATPYNPIQAAEPEAPLRRSLRAGVGLDFPSGNIAQLFALGLGASTSVGYTVLHLPRLDIDILGGAEAHIFFKSSGYADISWTRILLSADGRLTLNLDPIRFFLQGGLGVYLDLLEIESWWWYSSGSEFRFGPSVGGGIGFKGIEFLAKYHFVEDHMFNVSLSFVKRF